MAQSKAARNTRDRKRRAENGTSQEYKEKAKSRAKKSRTKTKHRNAEGPTSTCHSPMLVDMSSQASQAPCLIADADVPTQREPLEYIPPEFDTMRELDEWCELLILEDEAGIESWKTLLLPLRSPFGKDQLDAAISYYFGETHEHALRLPRYDQWRYECIQYKLLRTKLEEHIQVLCGITRLYPHCTIARNDRQRSEAVVKGAIDGILLGQRALGNLECRRAAAGKGCYW